MLQDSRKRIAMLAALFAVLVLVIILSQSNRVKTIDYQTTGPILPLNDSYYTSGDTVRFFNGRNIVDYSLTNGTSRQLLTNDIPFPASAQEFAWSADGSKLLLRAKGYQGFPELAQKLLAVNPELQISETYWWSIDTKTQAITPLIVNLNVEQINVEKLFWKGDDIYATIARSGDGGGLTIQSILIYKLPSSGNTPQEIVRDNDADIETVYDTATKNLFYNAFKGEKFEFTRAGGGQPQLILADSPANMFDITKDGSHYLWVEASEHEHGDQEEGGDLFGGPDAAHVMTTDKQKDILTAAGPLENPYFDAAGQNLVYDQSTDEAEVKHIVTTNIQNKDKKIYKVKLADASVADCVAPQGKRSAEIFFRECITGLNVFHDKSRTIKTPILSLPSLPDNETFAQGFGVIQNDDQSLDVTFYGGHPTPESRASVLAYLKTKGLDTNLLNISFSESD